MVLEKTLESPLDCKEIQPVHPKGDQSWVFFGRTDAKAETPILRPLMRRVDSLEKTLICSMLCGGLEGRGAWGRVDTYISMAESLRCPPEAITTVLIGYQFGSVQSLSRVRLCATP